MPYYWSGKFLFQHVCADINYKKLMLLGDKDFSSFSKKKGLFSSYLSIY